SWMRVAGIIGAPGGAISDFGVWILDCFRSQASWRMRLCSPIRPSAREEPRLCAIQNPNSKIQDRPCLQPRLRKKNGPALARGPFDEIQAVRSYLAVLAAGLAASLAFSLAK